MEKYIVGVSQGRIDRTERAGGKKVKREGRYGEWLDGGGGGWRGESYLPSSRSLSCLEKRSCALKAANACLA